MDSKAVRAIARPNVENFGFAVFLSLNASTSWGGVYPYLPAAVQTEVSTILYYSLQLAFFSLSYLAFMLISYRTGGSPRGRSIARATAALVVSGAALVAAMYVKSASLAFIVASAVLYGYGSAAFMIGWQQVFSAASSTEGSANLITGTAYSSLCYFALCLVPAALAAFLMPFVLAPLAGLCLWISTDTMDRDQPMFEDLPHENPAVYRNIMRTSLPPALSIGALGFCAGAMRFLAATHQTIANALNQWSAIVLLGACVCYLLVWMRRTISFDVMSIYRVLYPVIGIGLLTMPFSDSPATLTLGAAITYACFMLASLVMMIHCCQVSRDSGANPVFVYAFFGVVIYLMQTVGYVVGYASSAGTSFGIARASTVATASLFVLMVSALAAGQIRPARTTRMEFLSLSWKATGPARAIAAAAGQHGETDVRDGGAHGDAALAEKPREDGTRPLDSGGSSGTRNDGQPSAGVFGQGRPAVAAPTDVSRVQPTADRPAEDAVELRCAAIAKQYGLSPREHEVMGLLAHGKTGPMIAEELFISENTVRTHIKRIYAKMGVSKKADMLAEIERIELP